MKTILRPALIGAIGFVVGMLIYDLVKSQIAKRQIAQASDASATVGS